MAYAIGDEVFATKDEIKKRCQQIMQKSAHEVDDEDTAFLLQLFKHHDEWAEKSSSGVEGVRVYLTPQGTPCFHLLLTDGGNIDISFRHAIKCIPSIRSASRMPQGLVDFKAAARETIKPQTRAFRDQALSLTQMCPITGVPLTTDNAHVDHIAPRTFDQLLHDFVLKHDINPNIVKVGSQGGTVPFFVDISLANSWSTYHKRHAKLRLISQAANLGLPKPRIDWG